MSTASDAVKESAANNLLSFGEELGDLPEVMGTTDTRLDLLRSGFGHVAAILKAMLDADDQELFVKTEKRWSEEFQVSNPEAAGELSKYQNLLRMGLAMWAGHLVATREFKRQRQLPLTALRIIAERLETAEISELFDRAEAKQGEQPWTRWFQEDRPGTGPSPVPWELLRALILLNLIDPDLAPRPQEWMSERGDEIAAVFAQLEDDEERWSELMPVLVGGETWADRVAATRVAFSPQATDMIS